MENYGSRCFELSPRLLELNSLFRGIAAENMKILNHMVLVHIKKLSAYQEIRVSSANLASQATFRSYLAVYRQKEITLTASDIPAADLVEPLCYSQLLWNNSLALSTGALDPVIFQEEPEHSGELSGERHGLQLSHPCTLQQPFCQECCQNTGSCC